jgi:uncharacterized protein
MLRTFRKNHIGYNSRFGFALILLFGIPRFIFLSKEGRRSIGLKKPENRLWLVWSLLFGMAACTLLFGITQSFFGSTEQNSFVYISKSYHAVLGLTGNEKQIYFFIYSVIAMTFSPIGEELLYRGIIHGSFVSRWGDRGASRTDSLAFAITHLAHFGIVFVSGAWAFFLVPGLVWVVAMFGVSTLFFFCKQQTGSILGAIFSHAGFNLAMTYFMFYDVL